VFDLIVKGGVFMYPIILCSVISLAIFINRLWALRRKQVIPPELIYEIEDRVKKGKIPEAVYLCENDSSSIAKVFLAGLRNLGKGMWLVKEAIEDRGGREGLVLEKYLGLLSTLANLSTLLGLLGTVSGMMKIFKVISQAGQNPALLAGGIAEALITTFAGLCVAIPVMALHRILKDKAESLIFDMEEYSLKLIDIIEGSNSKQ
jgi:biopolymer transport protein ExbB